MSRYLETIQLKDGVFKRPGFHQNRMNKVHELFFPGSEMIFLESVLHSADYPHTGLYKCRLVYSDKVELLEFLPYVMKPIRSLKIVESEIPSLEFKPEDRALLNKAHSLHGDCDDVLIVVDGLVRDSWYCNIAFFDGTAWVTPRNPLISGVNRQSLVEENVLTESDIKVSDLKIFSKARLFNAMIEFGELELEISQIKA